MRLDWEIAKRGWGRYAAYPWATAAGVFTNTVFGFLYAYVLLAVYAHRTSVGGFDKADSVTYVWLAQSMIMTVYVFSWWELAWRIRDGSVATDLLRPLDPQRYWLAYDLGRAPYHFFFRGLPPFVFGALVFQLHYPTVLDAIAFVVSLVLAVVVSFGFRFIYNSVAFWLLDFRGVVTFSTSVVIFFSGMAIPLRYFPHTLRVVCYALPFASIIQTPVDVWLGKRTGLALLGFLVLQAFWAIALLGLGRILLGRATRKLVIQGG
ncbi:MAG TPA: ABC-2 family transporter protein [Gaiellaceae bacterium]|nr:ABC-2 family transporter protein [Gaiellaceae bacterium]